MERIEATKEREEYWKSKYAEKSKELYVMEVGERMAEELADSSEEVLLSSPERDESGQRGEGEYTILNTAGDVSVLLVDD